MKNGVTHNYSQDNFTFCYYDRDHFCVDWRKSITFAAELVN